MEETNFRFQILKSEFEISDSHFICVHLCPICGQNFSLHFLSVALSVVVFLTGYLGSCQSCSIRSGNGGFSTAFSFSIVLSNCRLAVASSIRACLYSFM